MFGIDCIRNKQSHFFVAAAEVTDSGMNNFNKISALFAEIDLI
jgi:hypothetical protein